MDGIRVRARMWSEWDSVDHECNQDVDVGKNLMVMGSGGA